MEKFDPIDIEFLINSAEVKADSKRVKDDIRGIGDAAEDATAKVGGVGNKGGIASPLRSAGNAAEVAGKKAAAARPQWNGLGNSINQLSRELPAFTYSAQTGFLALSNNIPILADEIGRLKTKNDALVASGAKGVPVWKQVLKSLLSWQTALSLGVTLLTIYGKEIGEFIANLFKASDSIDKVKEKQELLNKALEGAEFKKAYMAINELRLNLDLAKKSLVDKKVVVDQYNESIGTAAKKAKTLDDVEQGLVKNADAYIKMMLYKAAATLALEDASKKAYEAAQNAQKSAREFVKPQDEVVANLAATGGLAGSLYGTSSFDTKIYEQSVKEDGEKRKKVRQDQLKEEEKAKLDIAKQFTEESAKIAEEYDFNFVGGGGGDKGIDKFIQQRKDLLEKVIDLDREYARKKLDKDGEELQALKDKFLKVRELIEEFNKDPKNKTRQIDITGLGVIQENAEAGLIYKQETSAIKEELAKQKKLYQEIEEYKATFGIEKTREKYAEELKEYDSYAAAIGQKLVNNFGASTAVDNGTATAAESERVQLLRQAAKEEKQLEAGKYDELLASLLSFEQERNLIIEKYQEDRKTLIAKGDFTAVEELERKNKEALDKLDESYAKGTDEYKALIRGVEGLSETAARAVIANARKMVEALLAAGKIGDEAAREIIEKINKLEDTVNGDSADKLNKIASQIGEISSAFLDLGDSVGYFNEGLGDSITTMGELGGVAADAASSIAGFLAGGPAGIIQGISGAISAISGLFRIGAKSRESERKAKAELLKINQRIEDGERRINELLRQRNIQRAREIELTLEGIRAQREALALAQGQNSQDQSNLLEELQNQQYVTGSRTEKYGGFLGIGRKTRVVNEYASLLGSTFEEIERFYEQGQLEGRAAELFEQLRKLKEEGADINGMLADLEDQSREIFTGTTSNAIADSIIEGIRQGKRSFEDFAGDIEGMLQSAILNGIRYRVLEEPLQELYERFAEYAESEGELTSAEAQAIRNQYQEQVQSAIDQYEQWSQILDQDLLQGAETQNGLQGAIRREMTEETASELTGLFRGQYDITKRHFQLHEMHFELERRHFDATMRIMQYSALIEQNTLNTVVQLQFAVTELKSINTNTKPAQSARDLGRG